MKSFVLLLLLGSACAAQQFEGSAVAGSTGLGKLGPGDIFEVTVYGEKELSRAYRVATDGTIDFPLVGRVTVAGMNSGEVQALLTKSLGEFLRAPQVSIFVTEQNSQKIYVYGEVQKSGTFAFEPGMNIIQAITLAGGLTKLADDDKVVVTRKTEGKEAMIEISVDDVGRGRAQNVELLPGDIVFVPKSPF